MRSQARQVGLAVLAGVLLLAAFPPYNAWWASVLGMTVTLWVVESASVRLAYAYGALTGLVLFLPLLEWIRFLGVAPWIALAVLQALIFAGLGPLVALTRRSSCPPVLQAVALVGAVVVVEAVRARAPFGGLTWGRLAFGQSGGPLLPWAAVGGAPLVGAAVTVVALALLHAVRRTRNLRTAAGPAAALALVGAGAWLVPTPVEGAAVQVAAVQGDVPGQGLESFAEDLVVLDNHVEQVERLATEVADGARPRPDLAVLPENAADQDPRSEPQTRARLDRAVAALGQPFLLGAVLRDPGGTTANGILVYGQDGVQSEPYRKRHLVPFGEYLPLRALVEHLYPAARELLARDFTPGNTVGLLSLQGIPLAVGTCFEVAFDDLPRAAVRAGGQLLVLPSNNASYGRSAQSAQQLAMARLRAVEHSRSTVVATTSGISALVLPDGRVVARSGLFEPALLQAALPRRTSLTVATRIGPQLEASLAALVLLPLLPTLTRGRPRT